MALKRNERYPGRFDNPSTEHPQGAFKNRSAPNAKDGTYLERDWANDWDGFFAALLKNAGVTANGSIDTALSSQYFNALNEFYYLPVGIPLPWPTATAPAGWLKCDGNTFNKIANPKLASVYTSGRLPDLRGEFIRGWDDSRGIDPGRQLLSAQAGTRLPSIYTYAESADAAILVTPPVGTYDTTYPSAVKASDYEDEGTGEGQYFSTSNLVKRGLSSLSTFRVRPRNVAFNYIVRSL
jgi:hypothetical protein